MSLGLPAPASITLPSDSKSHPAAAASATLTTRSKPPLIELKLSLTKTTISKASHQPPNLFPLTSRTSTTSDVPSNIHIQTFKSTVISAPECQELFYLFQQVDQLARTHAYSHTTRDQDSFTAELYQPEISTGMLTAPTLSLYTTSGMLHWSEVILCSNKLCEQSLWSNRHLHLHLTCPFRTFSIQPPHFPCPNPPPTPTLFLNCGPLF